jgi:hypothetical protein
VKRSRRGGRRPQHSNHNQGGGSGGGSGYNPNRTFDSTGPEVKIRGSAAHVYEKYLQLARDANTSGDRVMAENYLQHAEHYYRILAAQQQQQQAYQAQRDQQYQNNPNGNPNGNNNGNANGRGPQPGGDQPYAANNGSSGPAFDLSEGNTGDEEEGDANGNRAEVAVPENEGF